MEYIFELEMQVRDYECDMEGIVNNAIYQHYLEHTRHEFLASSGISFIEMHERGVDPVSYTHLRAHETGRNLVCRLLLEKKKKKADNMTMSAG